MVRLFSIVAIGLATLGVAPARAQERSARSVRVVVEYIAGANLYFGAGRSVGIMAGDTMSARRADGREGRLRVISSTADRSVVTFAGSAFPVTRGDTISLELADIPAGAMESVPADSGRIGDTSMRAPAAGASVSSVRSTDSAAAVPRRSGKNPDGTVPQARTTTTQRFTPPRSARLDGSLALELDASNSETRWSDEPEDLSTRRFMTPALHLNATLSNLPGGARFETSLRYQYRMSSGTGLEQTNSPRIYQASLTKSFDRLPMQLTAGRFYNPIDLYGGYWDGASLRFGNQTIGIGGAAGFEPDRVNGGFRSDAPKTSVFTDIYVRGAGASYQAGVAVHKGGGGVGIADRYISGSQRLRVGRASLLNRMRVEATDGWGGWTVSQLDFTAIAPLIGRWFARASYARRSFDWQPIEADTVRPHNQRKGLGVTFANSVLSISTDASLTEWNDGEESATLSASMAVDHSPLLGLGFGMAATQWRGDDQQSTYLSPFISRRFGRTTTMAAYQRYHATGNQVTAYEAVSVRLSVPLPGGLFTSLRLQTQWGANASSDRMFMSLWKSF